jgi:hypothetical protein
LVDEADVDADGDGEIDSDKKDENNNGIDDDVDRIMKKAFDACENGANPDHPEGYTDPATTAQQPETEQNEPEFFKTTEIFSIIGRSLYVKES